MITAELTVIPLGTCSTSLSSYVAAAVEALKRRNVRYEISGMGTLLEAEDIDELMDAVKAAHEAVLQAGSERVYTTLKIDDRRDADRGLRDKVESVKEKI
ncbi:thiamine-binding protein [Methanothermobacter thermautotrophicus]|uniref:Thiamine-binding protein n=1 Tax=Methanothermobacter thermautotrophicus TaxID=145262 RepID=A0A842YPB6_METTF|nr:MTH1187 family thiamine-binding protein [Methanothermobacter thermautotrophicus]MBE2900211.1 thiamine-binding protein [Methanothermobacter thermautotrophicus]